MQASVVQKHARIESQQAFRRGEQRIKVNFFDPRMLHHLVETDHEVLQSN
jgi:hypothetical protein